MSIDAVAIVRVPYAVVCRAYGKNPSSSHATALEETRPFVPVGEDATGCFLMVPFRSEPLDLAIAVYQALGKGLADHADDRGVPILPDVAWSDRGFSSYEAAIAHSEPTFVPKLDENEVVSVIEKRMRDAGAGDLAPQIAELQARSPGGPGAMAAQAEQLRAMLDANPEAAEAMSKAFEAEMGDALAQAAKTWENQPPGGPGGFPGLPMDLAQSGLLEAAQQMLSKLDPTQRAQLEEMAAQMFGVDPGDEEDDDAPASGDDKPPIVDEEFDGDDDPPPK